MSVFIGDPDIETTYAAVGRALTRWEGVELGLATLYSVFIGHPMRMDKIREYGAANRIFAMRLAEVEAAASRYFIRHCCQELEGDFQQISIRATELSALRNNIAHGIANKVTYLAVPGTHPPKQCNGPILFLLSSPWYTVSRAKQISLNGIASREILSGSDEFVGLIEDIESLIRRLDQP